MHQIPFQERIDFYRYTSATLFLDQARLILKKIESLDRKITTEWEMHALWMSFFGLYAKPFKQQRDKCLEVGLRLPEDVIPQEFLNVHKGIIDLRDRMFAHTDFDSLKDDKGQPMNALTITVYNGKAKFGLIFTLPRPETMAKYEKLLDALIKTVAYRGTKIWKRWAKHLNLADNTVWVVNASNRTDEALLPCKQG